MSKLSLWINIIIFFFLLILVRECSSFVGEKTAQSHMGWPVKYDNATDFLLAGADDVSSYIPLVEMLSQQIVNEGSLAWHVDDQGFKELVIASVSSDFILNEETKLEIAECIQSYSAKYLKNLKPQHSTWMDPIVVNNSDEFNEVDIKYREYKKNSWKRAAEICFK